MPSDVLASQPDPKVAKLIVLLVSGIEGAATALEAAGAYVHPDGLQEGLVLANFGPFAYAAKRTGPGALRRLKAWLNGDWFDQPSPPGPPTP